MTSLPHFMLLLYNLLTGIGSYCAELSFSLVHFLLGPTPFPLSNGLSASWASIEQPVSCL
jgi:hypothetical protein